MVMSFPHSEWFVVVLAVSILCVVFQAQSVSRRRIVAAVALIVAAVSCKVLADGDVYILDPCVWLEPGSWQWYLSGCWWRSN